MGKETYIPLPHRQALNKTLLFTQTTPSFLRQEPHVYLRTLRATLRMSQDILATRSGVAKSHIVLIEAGKANVTLATLRQLFDAMFCDLLIVPKARKKPTQALAEAEADMKRRPPLYKNPRPWD
jgi:DNA-binding XRE family transcriptional regulator